MCCSVCCAICAADPASGWKCSPTCNCGCHTFQGKKKVGETEIKVVPTKEEERKSFAISLSL